MSVSQIITKSTMIAVVLAATTALAITPQAASAAPATATTTETSDTTPPDTPVGRQLQWLTEVSRRLPIAETEARQHFSEAFMQAQFPQLNTTLQQAAGDRGLKLESFRSTYLREDTQSFGLYKGADGMRWHFTLITSPDGIIQFLALRPLPQSWTELDQRLQSLGSQVSLLTAEIKDGNYYPVHGLDSSTTRPLASGFKLWVLSTLSEAIQNGSASWDEQLAVRDDWKANSGSPVHQLPAGTLLPLREYAKNMLYFSDNSATDHLIHRLGRPAIEQQMHQIGISTVGANTPLIATREMFTLKGEAQYPQLANQLLALSTVQERRTFLEDTMSPQSVPPEVWPEPRLINELGWFATTQDMAKTYLELQRQSAHDPVIGELLSLEGTTSLGLDTKRWPVGWFKGGSEPGVTTRSYYATTKQRRTYVVVIMVSDPSRNIGTSASGSELLTLGVGAFELLNKD